MTADQGRAPKGALAIVGVLFTIVMIGNLMARADDGFSGHPSHGYEVHFGGFFDRTVYSVRRDGSIEVNLALGFAERMKIAFRKIRTVDGEVDLHHYKVTPNGMFKYVFRKESTSGEYSEISYEQWVPIESLPPDVESAILLAEQKAVEHWGINDDSIVPVTTGY